MNVDGYGSDSMGFFRVTPPFWVRSVLVAPGSSDIELCGPECASVYFGRLADTWENRFAAHAKQEQRARNDLAKKNEALNKLAEGE
jgi:hypothetical protein